MDAGLSDLECIVLYVHLASAGGAAPRTTLMNERETVRHERRDETRRLTAHCLLWCPN